MAAWILSRVVPTDDSRLPRNERYPRRQRTEKGGRMTDEMEAGLRYEDVELLDYRHSSGDPGPGGGLAGARVPHRRGRPQPGHRGRQPAAVASSGRPAAVPRLTWGKPIVMGRRTHESIGKPLPGRRNIVITRRGRVAAGCERAESLRDALAMTADAPETVVIGGARCYREALPLAVACTSPGSTRTSPATSAFPIGTRPNGWSGSASGSRRAERRPSATSSSCSSGSPPSAPRPTEGRGR